MDKLHSILRWKLLGLSLGLIIGGPLRADSLETVDKAVVWNLDNLESIGGHKVAVVGAPRIIETSAGKAIEFDGVDDGLVVDANPLAGLHEFTVEVIFRPAAGGPKEQRFLHFQPAGSDDLVLFETRLPPGGQWFLDTYLQTGEGKHTLFAEKHLHLLDAWHHAAIVVDGRTMRHYVNGQEELSAEVQLTPLAAGQTSIGMRFNQVHWFQGAIRQIRITPAVLKPEAFLKIAGKTVRVIIHRNAFNFAGVDRIATLGVELDKVKGPIPFAEKEVDEVQLPLETKHALDGGEAPDFIHRFRRPDGYFVDFLIKDNRIATVVESLKPYMKDRR